LIPASRSFRSRLAKALGTCGPSSAGTDLKWIAIFDFTSERMGEGPIAIEQSERRPGGSPLNQEEFRLKRGRNRLNLGGEVLSDLREMRIEDPNDCGWKLLKFV
jgi:hypothetical protein